MQEPRSADVIVVGGGLAGLAAATYLARGGRTVTLFEQAADLGGRARTQEAAGFRLNLGPHALYEAGPGAQVYRELGIQYSGCKPGAEGCLVRGGRLYPLPTNPLALGRTELLSRRDKLALVPTILRIARTDPATVAHLPLDQWLRQAVPAPGLRDVIGMFLRVATYSNDPDRQSAGAALAQLRLALTAGVRYLDGGWQTLVDGLRRAAEAAGVAIVERGKVAAVLRDAAVRGVRLADGTAWAADAVVVAGSPALASELVRDGAPTVLHRWAEAAIPMWVASLDVGLERLPNPRARLAFGVDAPLYLSTHSAWARLAPEGGALIHVARYLGAAPAEDPRAVERELEGLLDLAQPGWRAALVARRFLPHVLVSNALVTAAQGGTAGRPGPIVPDIPGLYVAGDWVGPEGMLADASLASARQAARLILATPRRQPRPAAEPLPLGA
ncbi:MAG TPA: FAD-dependent oxidoreductase [Chloroflexota bacterium]|nr:FAD-dependent oxidoreductase [Chloroflexota bacterium]